MGVSSESDEAADKRIRSELRNYLNENPNVRNTLVSVVMPTRDRANELGGAIESVLGQTHRMLELLVIDDCSSDNTAEVVSRFSDDDRVRFERVGASGVGAARSRALEMAAGEVIAYLDSDNLWDPEFLSLSIAGLVSRQADVVYSSVKLRRGEETVGFRGAPFDYEKCLEQNYVDINAVCHSREALSNARFEPQIRRGNDWDFLLQLTRDRQVEYLPFQGVDYSVSGADRITFTEPAVYFSAVRDRHRTPPPASVEVTIKRLSLSIGIRSAAPREGRERWGDHHFAVGLAQAFQRLGHVAKVYYLGEDSTAAGCDVAITLRGLRELEPLPEAVNVLWNISHPDQVSFDEMDEYDIVFVASDSYARMLRMIGQSGVGCLRQATDRARFFPHPAEKSSPRLLFVGNSRGTQRSAVSFAIEQGLPVSIHGSGWEEFAPTSAVESQYIPNEQLSGEYARAGLVLNDHWDSMKDFGFVSNRIYDALASGATVISDGFPELEREFGDVVGTFSTAEELAAQVESKLGGERSAEHLDVAIDIINHDTLDSRAGSVLEAVHMFLLGEEDAMSEPLPIPRSRRSTVEPLRIAMARSGDSGSTNSAYARLILPLASDLDVSPLPEVSFVDASDSAHPDLSGYGCLVVPASELRSFDEARDVVERADVAGVPIALDVAYEDDVSPEFLRSGGHPLDPVVEAASIVWCQTEAIRSLVRTEWGRDAELIHDSIDPRMWRRYRNRDHKTDRQRVEFLIQRSRNEDVAIVLEVLEELESVSPRPFRLTVVDGERGSPEHDWLRFVETGQARYPRRARWLRSRSKDFDVALVPLAQQTAVAPALSDLRVLELVAMGLPVIASSNASFSTNGLIEEAIDGDGWATCLMTELEQRTKTTERSASQDETESRMWQTRNASKTGRLLLDRLLELAHD